MCILAIKYLQNNDDLNFNGDVRLVNEEKKNIGIVSLQQAKTQAKER